MKTENYVGAAIALAASGKKIGPYFLGLSLSDIQKKFVDKIKNPNFELVEVDLIHIKKLSGYKNAIEKLEDGNTATMIQ